MSSERQLPVRIRQGIRDDVEADNSRLKIKFASVQETLGHPLGFQTEWVMLWSALGSHYPDNATFVPGIVSIVCAFCNAFVEWLDQKDSGPQVDKILDDLTSHRILNIRVELSSAPNASRTKVTWRSTEAEFVIFLPKARPSDQVGPLVASFTDDLIALGSPPSHSDQDQTSSAAQDPEDWDALSDATPLTPSSSVLPTRSILHPPRADILPDVTTIDRPEELLKRPPYLLSIHQEGGTKVVVRSSHHDSLVLLEKYLQQWTRTRPDITNRPPVAKLTLEESAFGLGLLYDSLSIEVAHNYYKGVNATLIRVFVENVLGYEPVSGTANYWGTWEYRRLTPFK